MFLDSLAARTGASPLITHYDELAGSRVELSARTFTNWVDKTANLLEDLGVEPGEGVSLELATTHPGHWVTAVWVAAIWQRGSVVSDSLHHATAAVVGPESTTRGLVTVMCSLHPLGLGLSHVPRGCVDYAEVLAQPDVHVREPVRPSQLAWLPSLTHAQVSTTEPTAERRLLANPPGGWDGLSQVLVAPVLGGGSTVVVQGGTAERLTQIAEQERAVTAL